MAVKRSRSAARVLRVLETVASRQPVGVSDLARLLDADKSAVQRALMTLADEGWIRRAGNGRALWELTPHILTVAHRSHSNNGLRERARPILEQLRADTNETVFLTVPDGRQFVVIDALESQQMLRMAPPIGMSVPLHGSATGRLFLAYLSEEWRRELLGGPPGADALAEYEATRTRGYSISIGDIVAGSTTLAAPIFGGEGQPIGAVIVSGPTERMEGASEARIGALIRKAARTVSRTQPQR